MRPCVIAFLTLALTPMVAQAQNQCVLEHARYVLRGEPSVTAHFQDLAPNPDWLTNVAFNIAFAKQGDSFWWLFDEGSAPFLNMISTTDVNKPGWAAPGDDRKQGPLGETHVWFATSHYRLSHELPKPGQTAPQHIFVPDLQELMWYAAQPRRAVPTAFFDLASCG